MPLRFVPTLCLVIVLNSVLPGIATATPREPHRSFERPTTVRQPLPYTLQTAQDWQTVGMNALIDEDYTNSLQAFNKAVDLSAGQNPQILEQRGWVHYLQERYERAIADLNQAAALYQAQSQTANYRNVRRMRLFIETQADELNLSS
ncbi:tetratricopeptide repeat protein [Acaryochloris sp. IP29b_bin.148]|uniref:tetratricopeptide repeat protein n=1 Tax=Acaryochloris sp. IP29b_bin.148 TaxID=2969218 RepID=UPI002625EE66|nr:tetratricopeptide repeat protein [Acaryochloris sp. IP29b_bin.148]